jgi:hypothetical protein
MATFQIVLYLVYRYNQLLSIEAKVASFRIANDRTCGLDQ